MVVKYDVPNNQLVICSESDNVTLSFGCPETRQELVDFLEGETGELKLDIFDSNGGQLLRVDQETYKLSAYAGAFGYTLYVESKYMDEMLTQSYDKYENEWED